jgi:hypothetical protein
MNLLTASPTGFRVGSAPRADPRRFAFVEDFNWPLPGLPAQRKPARLPGMRMPGPNGPWEVAPAMPQ